MSRQVSMVLTVIALVALMVYFPILIGHWVIRIALAIPSAFTLGISTVLLYKAFRYPRGTAFSLLGLIQIAFAVWLIWMSIQSSLPWLAIPVFAAAFVLGPRSAKLLWKWLDVDRYYKKQD